MAGTSCRPEPLQPLSYERSSVHPTAAAKHTLTLRNTKPLSVSQKFSNHSVKLKLTWLQRIWEKRGKGKQKKGESAQRVNYMWTVHIHGWYNVVKIYKPQSLHHTHICTKPYKQPFLVGPDTSPKFKNVNSKTTSKIQGQNISEIKWPSSSCINNQQY